MRERKGTCGGMRKRFFRPAAGALCLAAVCLLTGCGAGHTLQRFSSQHYGLFDTVIVFTAYTEDREQFDCYDSILMDELTACHRLFDIYHDYEGISNIKTINDQAGIAPVKVDERIIGLLEESSQLYHRTGGAVNVAMGSVLSIWKEYRDQGNENPELAQYPPEALLKEAALHMDMDKVEIDREGLTVYLEDGQMRLDVGAVAKGYAAECAARRLEKEGLGSALLNVGGNVCSIGRRGDGGDWAVAVQDPDGDGAVCRVELADGALVTSGTYQRYYTVDGVRLHHIIHPELLAPWHEYESVTVLCGDSGLADGLSTALFNMTEEEGRALLDGMDGVDALWLYPDGHMEYTSGFEKKTEWEEG